MGGFVTELSTEMLRRVRVIQRIYLICQDFRLQQSHEPCLEEFERCILTRFGQELPEPAVAWTEIIVTCLRSGLAFDARDYMPRGESGHGEE